MITRVLFLAGILLMTPLMIFSQTPSPASCQKAFSDALEEISSAPEAQLRQAALRPNPHAKMVSGRFNLNGIWTFGVCATVNGRVVLGRYRLIQTNDTIEAVTDVPGWEHDRDVVLRAKFVGMNTVEGESVLNESVTTSKWVLKPDKIVILGPDSMKIGRYQQSFVRISLAGIYDAKCDEQNPQKIEGPSARLRGEEASYFGGDYRLAACWLRIGAEQDEPAAEGFLASLYYQGLGVPQDYAQAFQWASKSAGHGNDIGEDQLSLIYATGNGAQANTGLSRYWLQKARTQPRSNIDLSWGPNTLFGVNKSTPLVAAGGIPFHLLKPDQRNRRSGPVAECGVTGAGELSSDVQWKNSQIAFGEKNFPESACWALYSAIQGNTNAQMALAWFFDAGVGVDRHADATIMWYAEAAKKDDAYAEAYMASYFLFVGLDIDKSEQFQRKVKAHPGGEQLLRGVGSDFKAGPKPEPKPQDFIITLKGSFGDVMHSMNREDDVRDAYRQEYYRTGGSENAANRAAERAGKRDDAEQSFFGGLFSIGREDNQQTGPSDQDKAAAHDKWVREEYKTEARMIKAHLK